ncbi:MAG: GAF domain-containing protein [Anaerolineae bacterium]|nr:GAF domain-containing protein [Anaerolineae bacterium]
MALKHIVQPLSNAWMPRTLRAKLLLPIAGLMIISLLGSALAFVIGTALTQSQLLEQQVTKESERIIQALKSRTQEIRTATELLAKDPQVISAIAADTEESLAILNSRAVVIRDRFNVDLIQIYNANQEPRTNLLISSLYRESSLVGKAGTGRPVIQTVAERTLLLNRSLIPDDKGGVIIGLDLETEIQRILIQYRLSSGIGFQIIDEVTKEVKVQLSTEEDFAFDLPEGRSRDMYSQRQTLNIGDVPVELVLVRPITDIQQVTITGLWVMIISTVVTTGLLLALSFALTRAIANPIHRLSVTAAAIEQGELNRRMNTSNLNSLLKIGHDDEIGALANAFNSMVNRLQNLYASLEDKVKARTYELSTAAEVARTVSHSLDPDVVQQVSVDLLHRKLGFYHVGIFTVEIEEGTATLRKISGETGNWRKGSKILLEADTLVSAAAMMHSVCVVQDIHTEMKYTETPWLVETQSAAAVPLLIGQKVIGVLETQSDKPGTFTTTTINLLNTLADQIAIGVQNANLYQAEKKRRRFAEALELSGRVLSDNLDIHEIPDHILSLLHTLIPYERGVIWIPQDEKLCPIAQYGYSDERAIQKLAPLFHQCDIFRELAKSHQPLSISNTSTATHWSTPLWLPGDVCWLGIPMLAKGYVIGLIALARKKGCGFIQEEIDSAQSFALHAGIALENARLYDEIAQSQSVEQFETLARRFRIEGA